MLTARTRSRLQFSCVVCLRSPAPPLLLRALCSVLWKKTLAGYVIPDVFILSLPHRNTATKLETSFFARSLSISPSRPHFVTSSVTLTSHGGSYAAGLLVPAHRSQSNHADHFIQTAHPRASGSSMPRPSTNHCRALIGRVLAYCIIDVEADFVTVPRVISDAVATLPTASTSPGRHLNSRLALS